MQSFGKWGMDAVARNRCQLWQGVGREQAPRCKQRWKLQAPTKVASKMERRSPRTFEEFSHRGRLTYSSCPKNFATVPNDNGFHISFPKQLADCQHWSVIRQAFLVKLKSKCIAVYSEPNVLPLPNVLSKFALIASSSTDIFWWSDSLLI